MSGHHHSQRLILAHAEFRLQNYDDELAGREVIKDDDRSLLRSVLAIAFDDKLAAMAIGPQPPRTTPMRLNRFPDTRI
jgi:hypothetical protein